MNAYQVQIWGELTDDDFWELDLGQVPPETAWYEVPLPRCPDCGGDLVWDEAADGPGTCKCAGKPIGSCDGRPTYCLDGGCGSVFDVDARRGRVTLQRKQFHLT
jgi:hypothetical protein